MNTTAMTPAAILLSRYRYARRLGMHRREAQAYARSGALIKVSHAAILAAQAVDAELSATLDSYGIDRWSPTSSWPSEVREALARHRVAVNAMLDAMRASSPLAPDAAKV